MKIREIMTKDVVTCRENSNLAQVATMMWDGDFGCVPVVSGVREVVGVITDRDICMSTASKNRRPGRLEVRDVVSKRAYTCSPDDDVEYALDVMKEHKVRRLPVAGPGMELEGIVSLNDIFLAAKKRGASPSFESVVETMRAISEHRQPALAAGE